MRIATLICIAVAAVQTLAWGSGTPPENSRRPSDEAELCYWLKNMVWHHRFSIREIAAATGLTPDEITAAQRKLNIFADTRPPRPATAPLLVLPYPGGRHPRIGFLDGAVRPQRETKVSVFTPWDATSYVVYDVPEAIWHDTERGHELLYLAHTHVPTIWTRQNVDLEKLEWERHADGTLSFERRLPNQVVFGTKVLPGRDAVRIEMWLTNGTDRTLTGLRVQNCLMLKGVSAFSKSSDDRILPVASHAEHPNDVANVGEIRCRHDAA